MSPGSTGTSEDGSQAANTQSGGIVAKSNSKSSKTNQSNASGSTTQNESEGSAGSSSVYRGTAPQTGGTNVATIGKSIIIKGDLSGDEDLIIEGKVEGRVQLPNNQITVGADGRITADIEAKAIVVVGQTAGNLIASQRLEVQATGSVEGDITAPRLQIQEGATVNGSISMTKSPVASEARESATTSSTATSIGEQTLKSA